ncbi:ABC transporter permease [Alkalinema pantanalense CENA528]|uniref:ABC transporter permease n=1 Tax=Alkalinema pantanalense TaxID=1620705 RepID=UPI003D6FF2D4
MSRKLVQLLPHSSQLWVKIDLLKTLVQRDLAARYKGSVLGNFWTLINQLTQLLIYTYVFSVVLQIKLQQKGGLPHTALSNNNLLFALWLFAGLVPWTAVTGSLMAAATSVTNQPNLVKKVVFPLTLLPLVPIVSTFVDSAIGLVVLIAFLGFATQTVHGTLLLLPLVWIPQLMLTAGLGYLVAGLTVFLRDIPQTIGIVINLLFYLTPIMYPADLIPQPFRAWALWNPFTVIAEVYRDLVLWGTVQHLGEWAYLWAVATIVFGLGAWMYRRLTPAFADVL